MKIIQKVMSVLAVCACQFASAKSKFVNLTYGSFLDIPEGQVGVFQNANFDLSQYDGTIFSEVHLRVTTTNEELVLLPNTELNKLMPTFKLATGAGNAGEPELKSFFRIAGPARVRLGVGFPGLELNYSAEGVVANVVVCLEDKKPACCAGGGAGAGQFIPQAAVVIPADAVGPVQIVLESSVDMVTWTAADPGSYGASDDQRFFRVRATKSNP